MTVIAKINNAPFRAVKGPVGFIIPLLDSHLEVMDDVFDGVNAGCGAFRAAEGWDAVTGRWVRECFV